MSTGTRRIFIQRVKYGGATTRIIPALLTFLHMIYMYYICIDEKEYLNIKI